MDEAAFWTLIERARGEGAGKRRGADLEALRVILEGESDGTVTAFAEMFVRQMTRLYQWSVWGAAYVVQGGASDDGFLYFCEGLMGRGRAAVEQALIDADGLGPYLADDPEENESEGLGAVAFEILVSRGAEVPLFDDHQQDDLEGERFDEETVAEEYPSLAARFG